MVKQTEWRQVTEEVVILRSGVPGDAKVEAFALKHCERHYIAAATILRFFKGRLSVTDLVNLSIKKHRDAVAQLISKKNVLFEYLESQRRQG